MIACVPETVIRGREKYLHRTLIGLWSSPPYLLSTVNRYLLTYVAEEELCSNAFPQISKRFRPNSRTYSETLFDAMVFIRDVMKLTGISMSFLTQRTAGASATYQLRVRFIHEKSASIHTLFCHFLSHFTFHIIQLITTGCLYIAEIRSYYNKTLQV